MGARSPESTQLAGVFLARHGETDYNAEQRFQGRLPVELNARGRAQSAQLATQAATKGFTELWCSPLARARETAEIVGRVLDLAPHEDARLVESDAGDWTNRSFAEVRQSDPQGFAGFQRVDPDFAFPGGESYRAQTARVMEALREIGERPRPLLVICHAMVIRLAFATLGRPLSTVANAALFDLGTE